MSMAETFYKCLGKGRTACNGGKGQWPPVGEWTPPPVDENGNTGPLVACIRAWHVCTFDQLINWLSDELWEVEVEGQCENWGDKHGAVKARLVRRCEWWNPRTARLFMADCAERALPAWYKVFPHDHRLRDTIATVRRYAHSEATDDELAAARSAAADAIAAAAAAWSVAAARSAAADAARSAAAAAAWSVDADAAGWCAAAAAWSAADAAWSATADAAWSAADAARSAAAAARSAERKWQEERLAYYRDTFKAGE